MWFRKGSDEITESPAPDLFFDLINELDQDVLLLSGGDTPIIASAGVENLNILRDGKFLSPEILAIVRAVRRTGNQHTGKLDIPRGPIGEGTRELTLKVVALEQHSLVMILISDESEAQRVHEVRRDFVANISHELKTPIGALSLLSEAVLSAKDDPDSVTNLHLGCSTKQSDSLTWFKKSSIFHGCKILTRSLLLMKIASTT